MNPDKRKDNESYEQYRERLRKQKVAEKAHRKGVLVWDSMRRGTHQKPETKE